MREHEAELEKESLCRGFTLSFKEAGFELVHSSCFTLCPSWEIHDSGGSVKGSFTTPGCISRICSMLQPCGSQVIFYVNDAAGEPRYELRTPENACCVPCCGPSCKSSGCECCPSEFSLRLPVSRADKYDIVCHIEINATICFGPLGTLSHQSEIKIEEFPTDAQPDDKNLLMCLAMLADLMFVLPKSCAQS